MGAHNYIIMSEKYKIMYIIVYMLNHNFRILVFIINYLSLMNSKEFSILNCCLDILNANASLI